MQFIETDNINQTSIKNIISQKAQEIGFVKSGFSRIDTLDYEADKMGSWLQNNYNGNMHWLKKDLDKRKNPAEILPDAKTIISLAFNYYTPYQQNDINPKISRYAWGIDYHKILKEKLQILCDFISETVNNKDFKYKYFVDDGPIMEKVWARKSGLGWVGKNSLIINPDYGSWIFLSDIITNLIIDEYDSEMTEQCGDCTLCVDSCPAEAIINDYIIDARLCISYNTIENKNEFSDSVQLFGWIYGCDICQDVCTFNKNNKPTSEKKFYPKAAYFDLPYDELNIISEEEFRNRYRYSSVKRIKYSGWKRNLNHFKSEQIKT